MTVYKAGKGRSARIRKSDPPPSNPVHEPAATYAETSEYWVGGETMWRWGRQASSLFGGDALAGRGYEFGFPWLIQDLGGARYSEIQREQLNLPKWPQGFDAFSRNVPEMRASKMVGAVGDEFEDTALFGLRVARTKR